MTQHQQNDGLTRREALSILAAVPAAAKPVPEIDPAIVKRNDARVEQQLKRQITDPSSPWRGGYPDSFGLHHASSAGGILEALTASFVHPGSRFYGDTTLVERMRLAAGFLERSQSPDGNFSLLITNFNSPPDTGFIVDDVAAAASIARRYQAAEILNMLRPILQSTGAALAVGGVHTPNHRWVVSAALARIHDLLPDPRYLRRIDQWLGEGIDIDSDGQFNERSTLTYNLVTDHALIVLAAKLRRPELLDPVRRNLHSMLYLLHADGEVVTEISRRQDLNTRGDMSRYWFPLRYMAVADGDGRLASLAQQFDTEHAVLSELLDFPEMSKPLPRAQPLPDQYEKVMPDVGIARIRRGLTSATLILGGSSRFFTLRHGDAVIQSVRFASAFFGKGQFIPSKAEKQDGRYAFYQSLEAGYYQPLDRTVKYNEWRDVRAQRTQTEICRLEQTATVTEMKNGFSLRIQSHGTKGVPLAVEISLREGGLLEGCAKSSQFPDTWLMTQQNAVYRRKKNEIRFGPGTSDHSYTQIRGADNKITGPSVYLTGYTPYDHTIRFECA